MGFGVPAQQNRSFGQHVTGDYTFSAPSPVRRNKPEQSSITAPSSQNIVDIEDGLLQPKPARSLFVQHTAASSEELVLMLSDSEDERNDNASKKTDVPQDVVDVSTAESEVVVSVKKDSDKQIKDAEMEESVKQTVEKGMEEIPKKDEKECEISEESIERVPVKRRKSPSRQSPSRFSRRLSLKEKSKEIDKAVQSALSDSKGESAILESSVEIHKTTVISKTIHETVGGIFESSGNTTKIDSVVEQETFNNKQELLDLKEPGSEPNSPQKSRRRSTGRRSSISQSLTPSRRSSRIKQKDTSPETKVFNFTNNYQ